MKPIFVATVFFILLGSGARGDVNFGLSADENGIREFHLAVGDFYGVPEREVVAIRERRIPEEEMPVVLFLSKRAGVAPKVIVDLRLEGKSWLDITYYYGMGADIYYVETGTVSGPPYGKAIGYYKNKPRKQWKYIKLTDADVINLVNLKFISKHYGCSPDDVIKIRSGGRNFVDISKDAKQGKLKKGNSSGKSKGPAKSARVDTGGKGRKK